MSGGVLDQSLVMAVVEAATLAPSVHNTQPWRFVASAEERVPAAGEGAVIEMYADRGRALPVLDPTGRQLRVSCGAALLHAVVEARALGLRADVSLMPSTDADHLATLRLRPDRPPSDEERKFAAAARSRHTQREPFERRAIEPAILERLRAAAVVDRCWLHVVDRRDHQLALIVLLAQADALERSDPAYRSELHSWVRPVDSPSRDGVPASALPHASGPTRHSELAVRDFDLEHTLQELREGTEDERPTVVILGSDTDQPADQLRAGMALARVLLEATLAGIVASPLGQVVDLPATRAELRQQLGLLGEPQMLLRIGYGAPATATPRRPVQEVLEQRPGPAS